MRTAHLESAFEAEIVAHLVMHGWHQGDRAAYRRGLGLDPTELLTFVQATHRRAGTSSSRCTAAPTRRSSGWPSESRTS